MRKLTSLAMAGALALGLASFTGQASADEDPIIIGAAIALSGFVQPYDDGPLKGAQLAIADINAKGGVLGRQLTIITADTKSDPAQGTNAAIEVLDMGEDHLHPSILDRSLHQCQQPRPFILHLWLIADVVDIDMMSVGIGRGRHRTAAANWIFQQNPAYEVMILDTFQLNRWCLHSYFIKFNKAHL